MKSSIKKHKGFEAKKARYGFYFVLPWTVGMLFLFVIPLLKSLLYTFSDVGFADSGGIQTTFTGFYNLNYVFKVDPNFVPNLLESLKQFVLSFPIIVILSFIFALILNQKFHGRIFIRAIFFLPVIIATGVVLKNLNASISGGTSGFETSGGYSVSQIDFSGVLSSLSIPKGFIDLISEYVNTVFNLVWKTGIQVVLFVSGMQTIPDQLYEVSKIEGATKWEEFWFVTIRMMKNILLLVILYTMVDLFITVDSPVVSQAFNLVNSMAYGLSSAMLWAYILIALAISGVILLIYKKCCLDRW